jgi:plasmid stabilization system protein ParE
MTSLVYRPEAVADIEEACTWYERQRAGLGLEFMRALQAAEDAMRTTPLASAVHRRGTRRCLLRRFPYQLFYRVLGETIVVVACFHVRRSPRHLRERS